MSLVPSPINVTDVCAVLGCGHTRDRHVAYADDKNCPCLVKGCNCVRAWSFHPARYDGPDHIRPPGAPING